MARAECARCRIMFSSVSAFDDHLRDGGLTHVHPGQVKALRQRPDGIWGHPPDERSAARIIVLREERARQRQGVPGYTPGA